MTFWKTASKAQKLAQIDAGIELGMTARQVAMNLGVHRNTVICFANECGRRFPPQRTTSVEGSISRRHAAIRQKTSDNTRMPDAFDIFGVKESKWEMEL